jgi:glycosyltransferase involved in cell wall biosynthesis
MKKVILKICYVGVISEVRLIHKILDGIKDLDVVFFLAGEFDSEKYRADLTSNCSWKKVKYLGMLSFSQAQDLIKKSDVCLVPLQNLENYRKALPIKMFEYMNHKKFIIAQNFPIIKNILKESKCGIVINFNNTSEIKNSVSYILSNLIRIKKLGANGEKIILKEYNWENEAQKLINFYVKLESIHSR